MPGIVIIQVPVLEVEEIEKIYLVAVIFYNGRLTIIILDIPSLEKYIMIK